MNTQRGAGIALLVAVALAAACNKSNGEREDTAVPSSLSPEARAAAEEVLNVYESLRAQLAADAVAEVPVLAERLQRAAESMAKSAPPSLKSHAVALGAGARLLRESKGLEKLRTAFGEVSRQLVAVLVIEPSLRRGRQVFECPMAQGYKKWIQPGGKVQNPYMGKAMLECGTESGWSS